MTKRPAVVASLGFVASARSGGLMVERFSWDNQMRFESSTGFGRLAAVPVGRAAISVLHYLARRTVAA
jgi:hypothetical protein